MYIEKHKKEVFRFLLDYIKKNHYSPTLKEIGSHFKYSPQQAHRIVMALKKDKAIMTTKYKQRSIYLIIK